MSDGSIGSMPDWPEGMKPANNVWAFKAGRIIGKRNTGAKLLLLAVAMHADPMTGEWVRDNEDFSRLCGLGKYAYRTAITKLVECGLLTRTRLESGQIRFFLPTAPRGFVPEFDENGNSFGWDEVP
jgi:hypothetical protein